MIDLREAKLPKWAQDELRRLRSNLEDTENEAASAFGRQETAIEVDPGRVHRGDKPRLFLPDRASIAFKLDDGSVECCIYNGRLRVMGATWYGEFEIQPHAANVITAGFRRRDTLTTGQSPPVTEEK